jgi:2-oxoisovalerate dehydrogenase E1 component
MLRTAMALAKIDGRVVFFIEPIALYRTRDLFEEGDQGWLDPFPPLGTAVAPASARIYDAESDDHPEIAIVSWANGLWRSLRAARTLAEEHGVAARVVDLRWLQPLDIGTVCSAARDARAVLVVDEGRRTGGTSEAVITALVEEYPVRCGGPLPHLARYCGEDTFIPLGPSWGHVLPNEEGIVEHALRAIERAGAASIQTAHTGDVVPSAAAGEKRRAATDRSDKGSDKKKKEGGRRGKGAAS